MVRQKAVVLFLPYLLSNIVLADKLSGKYIREGK
ncbi:MAG: hypothetical protein FD145_932 [Candidatus Saganbacteria bacterium]|uniref:Uncharacterized protein n=1 Tax=Candidatus Saganbacteria bacterium TaxID=2575572 RepID=A0A833L101_UNCSA|nr:MAG: hypothetical protein FD145_932 [Candidatus Saganbacteria bacterium]